MTAPPAFQCYAKDLYTGTADLSPAEFGTYWRAICWSWDNGPLPLNESRLTRILMCSPVEFAAIWPVIVLLFVRTSDGLVSPKLERVRDNLQAFTAAKSRAGRASGRKRRHLSVEHNANTMRTQAPTKSNSAVCDLHSPISGLQTTENQDQEQRVSRAPHKVLVRLAHEVLDSVIVLSPSDVKDELKARCSALRLSYDAGSITRALDAAEATRRPS